MTQRTLSAAAGSLFGAISTTMDMAGKIVEDASLATDTLHFKLLAWREVAKDEAMITIKESRSIALERAAQRAADRRTEIMERGAKDKQWAKLYAEELDRLSKALED